jgi:hypothetical protein
VRNPWLTEANPAEIDVVAKVLTNAIYEHREKCAACREAGRGCTSIVAAIEAAIEWVELRTLKSKAATLRLMQNRREAA